MTETVLREQFKQFGAIEYVSVIKDKVTGTSRGFGYMKFFQFSHAAKAFTGGDPNYKPKFADPRPRWVDHRAHYGGSTGTKQADLRTNPGRGVVDIGEAREVKKQSGKAGNLGGSWKWKKAVVQRKGSYVEVLGRSRYREETTS